MYNIYIYVYIYIYRTRTYTCLFIYTIYICVYIYVYIYILYNTYTYAYIYIYIHMYTYWYHVSPAKALSNIFIARFDSLRQEPILVIFSSHIRVPRNQRPRFNIASFLFRKVTTLDLYLTCWLILYYDALMMLIWNELDDSVAQKESRRE